MNNKKSLPRIVVFSILTMITTFVWIAFEVYRVVTARPPLEDVSGVLTELNPTLDSNALTNLSQRVHLEDTEIGETSLVPLDATIIETEIEEATAAAEVETEENAN